MKNLLSTFLAIAFLAFTSSLTEQAPPSKKAALKKLKNEFGFVPSGNVVLEDQNLSVQAFYMAKTTVTNREYKAFLDDLKASGSLDKYELAKVDSMGWKKLPNANMQSFVKDYFNHPAYKDYPVVNVSKEGVQLYCEWLTEKTNAALPKENHLKFRIPMKAEWLRAAEGTNAQKNYTWDGPFLRNDQGEFLANFSRVPESLTSRNDQGELTIVKDVTQFPNNATTTDVLAPAHSYWPNEFGLYNLNGNVSEMLADKNEVIGGSWYDGGYDIRNRSTKEYKGASPMVGFRVVATLVN